MNTNPLTSSMFDSIKEALSKPEPSGGGKYLKTEVGNTYTVRLIPNIKDPKKTFFHFFTFGWKSFSTGQYTSVVSPQSFGERDPINEYRFKVLKSGTEAEKAKAKEIYRKENWMANVYVINDPKNPENNGTVKIFKFGRQLHKIIMEAIEGEDAESLGSRIFDLTPKGVDFKIKVEPQGEYPSYLTSKFTMPRAIDSMTDAKILEVYNSAHDLEKTQTVKSYDELVKVLDEHFHAKGTTTAPTPTPKPVNKVTEKVAPVVVATEATDGYDHSADIDKILNDLETGA